MKNVQIFRAANGRYLAIATSKSSWPAFLFTCLWVICYDVWKLGCFWVLTAVTLTIGGITLFLHDRLVLEASTVTTTFWVLYLANALILGMAGNMFRSDTVGSRGYHHVRTLSVSSARKALEMCMESLDEDDRAAQLNMDGSAIRPPRVSNEIVSIAERERIGEQDRNNCGGRHADATHL